MRKNRLRAILSTLLLFAGFFFADAKQTPAFNGAVKMDDRESTPDWSHFLCKKAPEGAPNILINLYDFPDLAFNCIPF